MLKIDRLDFPKKYPIPTWLKLVVFFAIIAGIIIHNCSQESLDKEIIISNVNITDFTRFNIEVEYTIFNRYSIDRDLWLLLRVSDDNGQIIGSSLFMVKAKSGQKQEMIKIIDKLIRPLELNEKPSKAVIEIYKRKVLS